MSGCCREIVPERRWSAAKVRGSPVSPSRRLAVGPCKTIQTDGSSPLKTIIPAVKKSP